MRNRNEYTHLYNLSHNFSKISWRRNLKKLWYLLSVLFCKNMSISTTNPPILMKNRLKGLILVAPWFPLPSCYLTSSCQLVKANSVPACFSKGHKPAHTSNFFLHDKSWEILGVIIHASCVCAPLPRLNRNLIISPFMRKPSIWRGYLLFSARRGRSPRIARVSPRLLHPQAQGSQRFHQDGASPWVRM